MGTWTLVIGINPKGTVSSYTWDAAKFWGYIWHFMYTDSVHRKSVLPRGKRRFSSSSSSSGGGADTNKWYIYSSMQKAAVRLLLQSSVDGVSSLLRYNAVLLVEQFLTFIGLWCPHLQAKKGLCSLKMLGTVHPTTLWPCIVSKLWSEREKQQDATVRCLLSTLSQHLVAFLSHFTIWSLVLHITCPLLMCLL